jgi:alpha,alpha-trehalase
MKKPAILLLVLLSFFSAFAQQTVRTPAEIYGRLFDDVQMSGIFPDSKTFPDCTPKRDPKLIVKDYLAIRANPAIRFSLDLFVKENFELPKAPQLNYITQEKDVVQHIKNLWPVLTRQRDVPVNGSSLLALPNRYIVPGGRFREVYYWDSYFTMLGLKESGEVQLMQDMIDNFAYLIYHYGHIPNGNRSYYISRSQPPFFSMMVDLLASVRGDSIYRRYLPALEKEYNYWMSGSAGLKKGQARNRIVIMPDGAILNRYWDDAATARPEGYKEDIDVAKKSGRNIAEMYHELRGGAASGIDFSSRWFADTVHLTTIGVTEMVAVDLNALMYNLENVLEKAYKLKGDESSRKLYSTRKYNRYKAITKYCFNPRLNYFCDYDFKKRKISDHITPAGMYPLCVFDLYPESMQKLGSQAAQVIREKLLKDGGVQTSEFNTGQQWDAPNGWAPLQWMTIWGFQRTGQEDLAKDISKRWIKLNTAVFLRTGKLMEKYNVVNTHLDAGGGEYPSQDGFGWTNGVLLALIGKYGQ